MIAVTQFHDPATVRLIATAYIDEPALAPLVDSEAELAILEKLEGLTSARIGHQAHPVDVDPAELLNATYGYGFTFINAAFCHARPPGNRFNDEHRGCWYAGIGPLAASVAEAEVGFHIARALREAGASDEFVCYRQLLAGFTCQFHDVRGMAGLTCLHPEPAIAYPAGQALARKIRAEGGNGVLYPSARLEGGECVAAFRPALVQNVRQGEKVGFEWNGQALEKVC
ncbi:RES family NAD+ phosphorylase [Aureimonas fodinaquatilis]|uniref:RES family NAD+ phosphorylase n=1 Tax=Aureimonas fodinaquatilis TaxID=2565783 RepID=A0A5B0E068_9HYPH|nr:RES family NAD+ phosphorylase [Aureimonas fodinaquatilis]KAA0972086.1 RES family NAD+ phosphorylase [Aureimonas fodinaquatilis]